MPDRPLIELTAICKGYTQGGTFRPVLQQLDLRVMPGEALAVCGPSGSGKSTLLNIISGLLLPDSGTVTLDGTQVNTLTETEQAALRRRAIGFVFQAPRLLPQLTAEENVLIPILADRSSNDADRQRAQTLLARLGLENLCRSYPEQMSGGECQRVAIARALMRAPQLLLADEPTGALDRHNADRLLDILELLNRQEGLTVILVTHSTAAAARMQRQYQLEDGTLKPATMDDKRDVACAQQDDAPPGTARDTPRH